MNATTKQRKHGLQAALRRLGAAVSLAALVATRGGQAGELNFDFSTDPTAALGTGIGGNNPDYYVAAGGNPGGFLAITYPIDGQKTTIVFPDTDPGKIVTGFEFSCDLRVGNSQGDRAADGFSISFARTGDPLLEDAQSDLFGGGCCAETGTKTGIAVSFDTWSGNNFPNDPNDKTDIEGIIVRVDDVTVGKVALPTRHGSADDITSLQTGPRDAAYWPDGDAKDPASWAGLAWRKFSISMTPEGKLTVTWKGNKVVDNVQTTFFPSGGRLVFAGRTGGENEHTHVDNIKLTTTAATVSGIPGAVGALTAAEVGSRRVKLTWTAATVAGDPAARVAYEVERDGTVIAALVTGTSYDDRAVLPGSSHTYKVRGKNIAGNPGPDASVTAKAGADVAGVGFLKAEQWNGISGTPVSGGLESDHYLNDPPDRVRFVNGFSFGETSNFGDTWGDNHLVKISGVFKAPKTGKFRFHIRSDDASSLYLNTAGAAIPDPTTATAIANETGCCTAFLDVGDESVSEVVDLAKDKEYGIAFVVKEGGGGDWGQVAIREEGDTTPPGSLTPLRGGVLSSPVDAVGANIAFTMAPSAQTVVANSPLTLSALADGTSAYGPDYGNVVVYQWYINGAAVLGANGPSYTIPVTPASLNNADIKVGAGVAGKWVESATVKLTVNPDTTAPTVASVVGSDGFTSVTFTFSEPVTDSALTVANYTVTGLTLSAPVRVNDRTIRFTTTTQALDTAYPVTVKNVVDNANLAVNFTGSFKSYALKTGSVAFGKWHNQSGAFSTWNDGTVDVQKLAPTTSEVKPTFWSQLPDTSIENYFGQLKALFIPAVTGDYVFFMAADDHAELYLSTDANPANKKKIAEEPQWSGERAWLGAADPASDNSVTRGEPGAKANRSDQYAGTEWSTGAGGNINLTAGKQYYLELLYKEGGGGDHGAATFKLKADADPADGSASTLAGDRVAWYVAPAAAPASGLSIGLNLGANATPTNALAPTAKAGIPAVAQANWNNLNGANGTNVANLVADNGGASVATTLSVSWSSAGTWASTGLGEENNKLTGADLTLTGGYLDTGASTLTSVKVAGIPAELTKSYDLYIYALGGVGGRGGAYRVLDGSTGQIIEDYVRAVTPTNPAAYSEVVYQGGANPNGAQRYGAGNYIVFRGLTAPNITIEASTVGALGFSGTPRAPINAIQLVASKEIAQDVTQPGDAILSTSTVAADSPAAEGVANVIDNLASTKYLNFKTNNTGFTVTPRVGSSIVTAVSLQSANDAPERDPASYKLEGSNDGTTFATISSGVVPAFSGRFITQEIAFANTTAYTVYRLTFPTVVDAPSKANSMQIAEVKLKGTIVGPPLGTSVSVARAATGTSVVVTYSGALQSAPAITGPWTDVPGAVSPYTAAPSAASLYWRTRK